jgi:protein-S-isoprenylcysteine O-methyltransferase Ste14
MGECGDAYRHYQTQMPMLIPWRGRVKFASPHGV